MASTYLTRTPSSTGNRRKFTFSAWVKFNFTSLVNNSRIFSIGNSTSDWVSAYFNSTGTLQLDVYVGGSGSNITTNRLFRDENAWYHVVFVVDTENSTADNRLRMYVNGEEETSLSSRSNPNVNWDTQANTSGKPVDIGSAENVGYSPRYFPGIMSHVHMTDGYAYAASDFGSTDSTTGEWRINTAPSVSYGTNGFFILKDGNSVTDSSSNSNAFTVAGGTLTKTEDCPSNVFCTMNPLNAVYISFLQGNNTISGGNNGSDYSYIGSTLAANSGKFYWEVKAADLAEIDQVGVALASSSFTGIGLGGGLQNNFGGKSVQFSNGNKAGDSAQSAHMGGFSEDDIMMVALDLDNNKITFGRNGQWSNGSGGADQTYANSTAAFTNLTAGEYYMPAHAMRGYGGNTGISRYNFGNGYFATTAVSSAGTNASNIGIFEYDVPSGFTALSTKGLNL